MGVGRIARIGRRRRLDRVFAAPRLLAEPRRCLFGSRHAFRTSLECGRFLCGSCVPAKALAERASIGRRNRHSTLLRIALPRNDPVIANSGSERNRRAIETLEMKWLFLTSNLARGIVSG